MQTSARILAVLFFFLLGLGTVLVAQERSRQGGPPGSFQGQVPQGQGGQPPQTAQQDGGGQPPWGGGAQGGPSGGPPGGRGGPGSGPPGGGANTADRNARMISMLRSMDVNQTGVLNPNDIPENRRGFVNAIATQFGMDPNRPIHLADLERRAAAAGANAQSNVTAQPRANPQSSGGPTSGNNRSESGGSGRSSTPVVEPLVPPFGEEKPVETPVIGFGQRVASATPTISRASGRAVASNRQPQQAPPATLKQSATYDRLPQSVRNNPALDWFFSYDADKDAQLTMQEYVNGRDRVWTPQIAAEFQSLDKNGDGLATIEEVLAFLQEMDDWRATQAAQTTEQGITGEPAAPQTPPTVQPRGNAQPASQARQSSATGTRMQAPANSSASPWENRGGNSPSSGNTVSGNAPFDRGGGGNTGRSTQQRGRGGGGGR